MTHPFDEEAIQAGAKAIRSDCFDPEFIKFFEDLWCRTEREKARESAKAALAAAWASLVERGLVAQQEPKAMSDNEELRLLRRIEGLIAANQKLREALEMTSRAMNNWVCLSLPGECVEEAVQAALVDTKAGVLCYTAEVEMVIRAALEQEPKP